MSEANVCAPQAPVPDIAPWPVHLRLEDRLLLRCARHCPAGAPAGGTDASLRAARLDWGYLLRTARVQGVLPLLHRNLDSVFPGLAPAVVRDVLKRGFDEHAAHGRLLADSLISVLQLLEQDGVTAIPYKGPTLALAVYGDLALRQFSDLDILVPEHSYRRAQAALLRHGYRIRNELPWEISLTHPSEAFAVDLHRRFGPRDFDVPLGFQELWQRRSSVVLRHQVLAHLSPPDLLQVLSAQIVKNAWELHLPLIKICDVAALVDACRTTLDWRAAKAQAQRLGSHRMLAYALRLTHLLLAQRLPPGLGLEQPLPSPLQALVEDGCRRVFPGDETPPPRSTLDRFRWAAVRERRRDRLYPYLMGLLRLLVPSSGARLWLRGRVARARRARSPELRVHPHRGPCS